MPKPDPEKIRAWRRRSKPLRRRNPKRAAKNYDRNYGERADAVRDMNCLCVPLTPPDKPIECRGRIHAAHVEPRRMGGCGGDRRKLANLCEKHHKEAGELPAPGKYEGSQRQAFEEKWGVDLMEYAAWLAEQLDEMGYP